jgi:hypothetical protein
MAKAKSANQPKAGKKWDAKLSHKVRHTIITVLITLLLVGGGGYAYYFFSKDIAASITPSSGLQATRTIAAPAATNLSFDEAGFAFKLPANWKRTGEQTTGPYHKYSYQSTLKNNDNRYIDIYLDGIPAGMAVNKAVAVRSEGSTLTHGMVSGNCTEFTAKVPGNLAPPA